MSDAQTGPRPPEAGGPHLEQGVGSQGRCGGRERFSKKLWTTGPGVRSPGTEEPHDSGTPDPRHPWPLGCQPHPANRPRGPPQHTPIRPRLPLIPTPTLRWRLCALLSGWLWGSLLLTRSVYHSLPGPCTRPNFRALSLSPGEQRAPGGPHLCTCLTVTQRPTPNPSTHPGQGRVVFQRLFHSVQVSASAA